MLLRRASLPFVVLAFVVIVAAFGVALVLSERTTSRIHGLVRAITDSANPAVVHLVQDRTTVSEMQIDMVKARHRMEMGQPGAFDPGVLVGRLDADWRAYASTPLFPGENELRTEVRSKIDDLEVVLRRIAAASSIGDSREATRLIEEVAPGAVHAVAEGLMGLILLNQQNENAAARSVEGARRASARVAWSLGVLALALSLVLATAVVLALRRLFRLQTQRDAVLEQRAAEHEIFAARVVHDIRAPLAVAQLWVERSRKQPTDDVRALVIDKVETSIGRATRIIEDLYALVRANMSPGARLQTPLQEAVQYAVDEVASRAAGAGIDVTAEAIPDVVVAASPGVVASLLSNLLSNAVNYAGRGAHVFVSAIAGERVRVSVADTGVGLSPDAQERIFRPYVRGPSTDAVVGLGLGLATVKSLAERSGGTCGVESVVGRGSVFWFELPTYAST